MNNYGYYREHQQEIDRKIAEENAQNTVEGVQGIILVAMIIIAIFIGAYFVIYPPLSRRFCKNIITEQTARQTAA